MDTQNNERTAEHLMHLIAKSPHMGKFISNFSLLLGSGASSTSNVMTAQQMIDDMARDAI